MRSLIADAVAKEMKGINETEQKEVAAEKQLEDFLVSMIEKVGGKVKKPPVKPANVAATAATDDEKVHMAQNTKE
jgi:hypothetical protein